MTPEEFEALPWEDVASSNLARVAFIKDDPEDFGADGHGTLYLEFHGGRVYRYLQVSYEAHTQMLEAESVGGYLNSEIKPAYECERVHITA